MRARSGKSVHVCRTRFPDAVPPVTSLPRDKGPEDSALADVVGHDFYCCSGPTKNDVYVFSPPETGSVKLFDDFLHFMDCTYTRVRDTLLTLFKFL